MKFCKCQNLNSLFRKLSFPELPKYSWYLQMLSIIEKFKYWKIILKNSWKIGTPFGRRSWKIDMPLAHWQAKLHNWYTFGTFARLLERCGALAHGHRDHAGTHGTQFSKLPYALWKCKCDHENYN